MMTITDDHTFGPADFAARRQLLGLTLDELAAMLRVNPRTVRSWETGRDQISPWTAMELAGLTRHHDALTETLRTLPIIPTLRRSASHAGIPGSWFLAAATRVIGGDGAKPRPVRYVDPQEQVDLDRVIYISPAGAGKQLHDITDRPLDGYQVGTRLWREFNSGSDETWMIGSGMANAQNAADALDEWADTIMPRLHRTNDGTWWVFEFNHITSEQAVWLQLQAGIARIDARILRMRGIETSTRPTYPRLQSRFGGTPRASGGDP